MKRKILIVLALCGARRTPDKQAPTAASTPEAANRQRRRMRLAGNPQPKPQAYCAASAPATASAATGLVFGHQ
ncbi:MAG: hypothetical protein U1F34_05980 [Gammaproteobacteria bacterium]